MKNLEKVNRVEIKVNRVEIIDEKWIIYTNNFCKNIRLDFQDNDRDLKIFLENDEVNLNKFK